MKRVLLGAFALVAMTLGSALAQSGPPALSVYGLRVDDGTKTATATAGAATLNKAAGKVTTEALTTAAGANYTLTITNSTVAAATRSSPRSPSAPAAPGRPSSRA